MAAQTKVESWYEVGVFRAHFEGRATGLVDGLDVKHMGKTRLKHRT